MFFNSTWSRRRIAAALVTNAFYICVFTLFVIGAYLWVFQVNRTQSLAINPVLYPQFTEVDTSDLCCTSEPYYKLWRIYDWIADGYAVERHDKEHIRVPLIYIHGNGGSFFCARSLARFIYEANVRQRVKALHGYRQRVKIGVYEELEKLAAANAAGPEMMTDLESNMDRYRNVNDNVNNKNNDKFTQKNNECYDSMPNSVWPTDGSVIASSVQRRVEHDVVHNEMPLLGLELFSVDFLEESNTQSGTVTIKEARYVNHSLHVLMHNFVETYTNVISSANDDVAGEKSVHDKINSRNKMFYRDDCLQYKPSMYEEEEYEFREQEEEYHLDGIYNIHGEETRRNTEKVPKVYPLTLVETEYINSICNHRFLKSNEETCLLGQELLSRFSTHDRVRAEVLRVRENGLWIWGESLGGAISLLAALLSPQLVEGLVYVGTPLHYPPLLFNDLSSKLYSIIARAVLFHSTNDNDELMESNMTVASEKTYSELEYNASPISLIDWLYGMKDEVLSARMSSITKLSINGGALDDVIPSTASYLHRSTPRRYSANTTECTSSTFTAEQTKSGAKYMEEREQDVFNLECFMNKTHHTRLHFSQHAAHRDISTEALRGCGLPMDHRGMVYGSQFLETSANSLVDAALLPDANAHFAFERELPELHRDRLFASITETLPEERQAHQNAAFEFARRLEWKEDIHGSITTKSSILVYHSKPNSDDWVNVCSNRSYAIDWNALVNVTSNDKQTESSNVNADNYWNESMNGFATTKANDKFIYYDGSVPLDIFLGVSTYDPEELYTPSLHFYYTNRNDEFVEMNETHVEAKAVSKLHLPFLRKDGKPHEGQTLRTAVSFHVSWNATELSQKFNTGTKIWPQFCFLVKANAAVTNSSTRNTLTQHEHYSFVQYDRIDPRSFVHERRALHLGPMYMGNAVRVEKHKRFVLVDGVDSTMQERKLSVRTRAVRNTRRAKDKADSTVKHDNMKEDNIVINTTRSNDKNDLEFPLSDRQHTFPVTLCGSLHSFYLAMRGNNEVAYDEPLEQLQYFFGPFDSSVDTFHYSWQPHRTFPWNWNETYIVYTINNMRESLHEEEPWNDNVSGIVEEGKSLITLHDFERLARLPIWSPARIMLLVMKEPEQLLAFFSANSEIGKLGGSYIVYFFCLLLLTGVPEEHFYVNTSLWNAQHSTWRLLQWLYNLHPFTRVTIYAVLFELMSSAWVSYALSVCTSPELQSFTLEEAEKWMSWKEKITLLIFYGVWPDARTCRYSWIWMQTINEGPTLLCKVMSLYVGFCVAALLMTIIYAGFRVIRTIAYAFHCNITKPLIVYWPKWGMVWLTMMWLTPFVLFLTPMIWTSSFASPWPLSYLHVFATCWAHGLLSIVPVETAPGYNFQWPCTLLSLGSLACAHFEGLILTIRNQVQLHEQDADYAFWDHQRQAVTLYESVIFLLIQLSLATLYLTCYYVTQHNYAIRELGKRKKEVETTISINTNTNLKANSKNSITYESCREERQVQEKTKSCHNDDINTNSKTNFIENERNNIARPNETNHTTSLKINGNGHHSYCSKNSSDENQNNKFGNTKQEVDEQNGHDHHQKPHHPHNNNNDLHDNRIALHANTMRQNAHYTLGELNRKHQTLSNLLHFTEKITFILLVYTTLVVMRRPLEGDIVQLDIVFHLFYLSCFVLRRL